MLFINNFNLCIFLFIIQQTSAVSYNQPTLCSNSSWNPNATTVANISTIGSSPYDIFINTNNTIYVPNQDTGQIIVWSEGNLTTTRNISGNLVNSSSLFVTTTGDIYVDTFHTIGGISQITLNLTINIPTMNICQQCWDLFININNVLYCSLSERHQIIAKSLNNDLNLLTIVGGTGSAGSTSTTLNNPRGIFVDNTLNLYVADCGNNRIQLFQSGKLSATTIVGNGSLNITITLNCPTSIILDGNNYLYIVDSGNNRIVGSNASGFRCIIGCYGSSGSASYQLNKPWAVSFDSSGDIFVSDQGNNRIQKFSVVLDPCGFPSGISPRNETVYPVWNTTAGENSTPATPGSSTGNYPSSEGPDNVFDGNPSTKFLSFGDQTASSGEGLKTGFYFTNAHGPGVLVAYLFASGNSGPVRAPLAVTIEGSNSGSLTLGSSWTLIGNNVPTGLLGVSSGSTYGTCQTIINAISYASYRVLVTNKNDNSSSSNSVEIGELEMYLL